MLCRACINASGSFSAFWCVWVRNVDALIFMLGWDRYGFNKKCTGTHCTELVFLHLAVSVGHVVHSGASRVGNVNILFFMLG
jgi:hypothetical protein